MYSCVPEINFRLHPHTTTTRALRRPEKGESKEMATEPSDVSSLIQASEIVISRLLLRTSIKRLILVFTLARSLGSECIPSAIKD